jgi:hypothetical protein
VLAEALSRTAVDARMNAACLYFSFFELAKASLTPLNLNWGIGLSSCGAMNKNLGPTDLRAIRGRRHPRLCSNKQKLTKIQG